MRKSMTNRQLYLFSTIALILSGCGGGQAGRTPASTFSASAEMVSVADLTTDQRAIATRICYAYQSKNTNFRSSLYSGGTFSFSVDYKDCSQTRKTYPVSGILQDSGSGLIYKSSTSQVFEPNIQTNSSGFLARLCTKIQNNQPISNTATDGTDQVQISFFKDTMDGYTIKYFSLDKGKMAQVGAETFKVRTQFNIQPGQILGMDEVYAGYEACSGTDKAAELFQYFTGFKK